MRNFGNMVKITLLFSLLTLNSLSLHFNSIKYEGVVPIQDLFSRCSKMDDFPKTDKCYKFKVEWICRVVIKLVSSLGVEPPKDNYSID